MLQLVTAVIKPQRIGPVKEALKEAGVAGMTLTEATGFGRQGGHSETYRGAEYKVEFVPKIKIEVLCMEADVSRIADVISMAARTGEIGDGKIWVTPVIEATRIRTEEMGEEAV